MAAAWKKPVLGSPIRSAAAMAAAWKMPVIGSPIRSAAAPSTPRRAFAALMAGDGDQVRTPRGYVPLVLVGDEEGSEERIMVRVEMLKEPRMAAVLEMAAQQFGYAQPGVLRIPCRVDQFQQMVGEAEACEAR